MVGPINSLLIYGIAFACGFGFLKLAWLVASFAGAYVLSIFEASETNSNSDFRHLKEGEFQRSELNIKLNTAKRLVIAAIFYGIGYGVYALGWF